MRFEVQSQQWNPHYPYSTGWAIIDTEEQRQVGYFAHKVRADERAAERNGSELTQLDTKTPSHDTESNVLNVRVVEPTA